MKFLILFACAVAAASAGYVPVSHQPIHLPLIDSTGVPVDTAEVQHAKHAHAVAHVEANARQGYVSVASPFAAYHSSPVVAHHAAPVVAQHVTPAVYSHAPAAYTHAPVHVKHVAPHAYPTTHGVPAVTVDGTPLNTPEVAAAGANHFAAHVSRTHLTHHLARRGIYSPSVYAHATAVVSHVTPAVYSHAQVAYAHGPVSYAHGPVSYAHSPVAYAHNAVAVQHVAPHAYPTTHGVPAVTVDGTPLNTPEVAAAGANHFAAHVSRNYLTHHLARRGLYTPSVYAHATPVVSHVAPAVYTHSPLAYAQAPVHVQHVAPHAYPTTHGVPAVTVDGTPLNTPEVAAATADHIHAYNHEALRNSIPAGHHHGVVAAPWAAAVHAY